MNRYQVEWRVNFAATPQAARKVRKALEEKARQGKKKATRAGAA